MDDLFRCIDPDGNGCVTEEEFNQIPGANQIAEEDMPAFQDVAMAADGIADCISLQDFIQHSTPPPIVRPEYEVSNPPPPLQTHIPFPFAQVVSPSLPRVCVCVCTVHVHMHTLTHSPIHHS